MKHIYKLQFKNDETSCRVLMCLVKGGWKIEGYSNEDGYSWITLSYAEGI
jgi:hypothetical protein